MITYKFNSREEYLDWCEKQVQAIKLAVICANNDKIREIIKHIDGKLHIQEYCDLYP